MPHIRKINSIIKSVPTLEGAGVHLNRAFGYNQTRLLDPFLLLDVFHSNNPDDYKSGFPWHPHRGIETITYVLSGNIEHSDSIGNKGVIKAGDAQWMTAGSGIIHQEMPNGGKNGLLWGLQLWANLPSAKKMTNPQYREIKSKDIPEINIDNGVKIRIISGSQNGITGPVQNIEIDPEFLDISIEKGIEFDHKTKKGYTAFAYILEGSGLFDGKNPINNGNTVIYEDGNEILITSGENNLRILLVSGKPINEPIAWQGPIVMNTEDELRTAFMELENDTFLKNKEL